MGSRRLTSYDLETGKEVWFVDDLPPQACATPLLHGSRVFVTATGMYGEPETLVDLPKFADLLTKHDSNQDLSLSEEEIPADLMVIDRRASQGAGATMNRSRPAESITSPSRPTAATSAGWDSG